MNQFKVGDRVRFKGDKWENHETRPQYYPLNGTIGIVMMRGDDPSLTFPELGNDWLIQWPKGSTSEEDQWWAHADVLELVADDPA